MKKKYIAINDLLDLSEELQTEEELAHELLMSGESAEFVNGVCWGINHFANQAFLDPRCLKFDPHEPSESKDEPHMIKAVYTEEEIKELKEMLDILSPSHSSISILGCDTDGVLEKNICELFKKYKRLDEKLSELERRVAILETNVPCPYSAPNTFPHSPFSYGTIVSSRCPTQE